MRHLLDRSQLPTPSGRLARAAARPALLAAAVAAAALAAAPAGARTAATPTLAVSPNAVALELPLDGGAPAPHAVLVRGLVGAQASAVGGLAIASIQYQTLDGVGGFGDWLQATLDRTTTPAVLTLRTNGTPVPDGRYRAVVTLTGEDVAAPATVALSLTRLAS